MGTTPALAARINSLISNGSPTPDLALDQFLKHISESGVELYPAQEEAILELFSGKNVILNTPTGSGKSLVATALHFQSVALGRRSIYTSPIKALVNEKFLALCRDFGPELVGMATGDASVNSNAPILCCTAEILANDALRLGEHAPIQDVVMDEFHYYSDRERGVAWQIPLLTLPQTRFLLMSATLGDTEIFEKGLTQLNRLETVVVKSNVRPVPLDFQFSENALHEMAAKLIEKGRAPIYVVNFSQRECAEVAQNFMSVDFCSKEEKKAIATALEGTDFSSPYGKEIQRTLKHGIGLHHAGLLPKYRILVEKLAQKGLLKLICGTDTLGVGVNVPIRTVLFTKLCKYDGEKTQILTVRDFHQISGRAGRKGFDDLGTVVAQAPEHVIENLKMEQKGKKYVKRKPPEKGFVPWTKETFEKLISGKPEALTSRFQVTHGMLLNVLSRDASDRSAHSTKNAGFTAMKNLIRRSHESPNAKKQHRKFGFQLFRSLVERKIIELNPLRVNVDLQQDFSLNRTLSLYLIDTIQLLDPPGPNNPDYALDLLTLVESILENPELILRKQLDALKTEKMAEMKMEGIEYDQRIEELEKLEYPKPNRDFIYDTFNDFSAKHPWVGQENIRPKSIARAMYENFQSFAEYIRDLDLQRVEGLLLRYLSDVYKALEQTVPDYAKDEEVRLMTTYFSTMVREIDSSLLDEWEKLRNPNWVQAATTGESKTQPTLPSNITSDLKSFTILVRNEIFRVLRALASGNFEAVLSLTQSSLSADQLDATLKTYYSDHSKILTDPRARNNANTKIKKTSNETWEVQQVLVDPEGHNDWEVTFKLDLASSAKNSKVVLTLESLNAI